MGYQVLARKWRPNQFSELVGQEHVVNAISNALNNNRLHHAYLFTGTRGVGKTTIARIFSKSLNCEQGMSATPCGQCHTCQDIEQGRYVDLLEIDAASRTKVEDTRELLDNVQYKPTRGQFKVYLIDEVHMLSKHSFNALLKTLEEPPPHVKFLLATTDPQKLPVTILSRCLQFNLKALSNEQIISQLQHVLTQESIAFEPAALHLLARAAQGSMRDALSLTDQAIAQSNGKVFEPVVTDMLGLMDKNQVLKLVHSIFTNQSTQLMQQVEQIASQAPDYAQLLSEIMSLLHQVALTQFVPEACKLETVSAKAIYQLSKLLAPEQVQLCYQIALQGRKDIVHAADGRSGLEMTLLRMLAFNPTPIDLSIDDFTQLAKRSKEQQTDKQHLGASLPDSALALQNAKTQAADNTESFEDINPLQSVHDNADKSQDIAEANRDIAEANRDIAEANRDIAEVNRDIAEANRDIAPESNQNVVDLNAQQQDIIEQASALGYDTQSTEAGNSGVEDFDLQNDDYYQQQQFEQEPHPVDSDSSSGSKYTQVEHNAASAKSGLDATAGLIALKNRLANQTENSGDDETEGKKSETSDVILSSPRATQDSDSEDIEHAEHEPNVQQAGQSISGEIQTVEDKSELTSFSDRSSTLAVPNVDTINTQITTPSRGAVDDENQSDRDVKGVVDDSQFQFESSPSLDGSDDTPPWPFELDPEEIKNRPELEQEEPFDPNAHLEEVVEVDVDFDVPAFLESGEKVVAAKQLDSWSQLIEQMEITALTKQLALHSAYEKNGNQVHLKLLDSKPHLDTEAARNQLQQALSSVFEQSITLTIEHTTPVNTPFAVQQTINQVRMEYAKKVVDTDESIGLLKQVFSAQVVAESIKPR